MKAIELYEHLEKDFINSEMSDDWAQYMNSIEDFITPNFKKRSMGLVCDFTKDINKVYTAVFPSNKVMKKILDDKTENAMLFVHHPSIWDITKAPEIFHQMNRDLLQKFKDRKISIYNLHVPLDNFGEYSTSVSLTKALGLKIEKPFAPYFGVLCGVIGKTNITNVQELRKKFEDIVEHKVSLYNYGDNEIKDKKIAIIAGGGNKIDFLENIAKLNINTFITGVSIKNDHSKKAHDFAKKHKINVLGGTHYSSEKFACISMVNYFKKLGLESEFIEDKPLMEDI